MAKEPKATEAEAAPSTNAALPQDAYWTEQEKASYTGAYAPPEEEALPPEEDEVVETETRRDRGKKK